MKKELLIWIAACVAILSFFSIYSKYDSESIWR